MLDLKKCAALEIARQSLDADLAFRIRCRRNKLLGLWAAAQMDLDHRTADVYARSVVARGVDTSSDGVLAELLAEDARKAGTELFTSVILAKMERSFYIAALEYAATETPPRVQATQPHQTERTVV